MTKRSSIYKLAIFVALLALVAGCNRFGRTQEEVTTRPREAAADTRGYDPLELSQDTMVVPLQSASPGATVAQHRTGRASEPSTATDSLYSQVFRVQLVTCDTYGEGRAALRAAEEIFDQPVYMDYDVPYFKVRVGDFATRGQADAYQRKAAAAGYVNAWVVAVTIGTAGAAPMYENTPVSPPKGKAPSDNLHVGQ